MVLSISKRLLTMLDNENMTDVVFDVQGQQFKCHKLVLSSCETRLKQLVAESPQVTVDDVAPHTFQAILKYLYSDECLVTDANVFELMHAAKIFKMAELECECSEFILKKLTEANVSFFTSQALQFDAKDSLKVCLDFFKKNTLKVLTTDQFLDIPQEVLQTFSENKSDDCSESRFFTACYNWAKAECKRKNLEETRENFREVLTEELINEIEYDKMGLKEFLNTVIPTKVLTHEEIGRHVEAIQGRMIQVTVTDHCGNSVVKTCPSSTSIYELKKKKLWYGGQKKSYPQLFTLSHNEKNLHDKMILGDLCTSGNDLNLRVNSFEINLRKYRSLDNESYLILDANDSRKPCDIIAEFLYSMEKFDTTKLMLRDSLTFGWIVPESIRELTPGQGFFWSEEECDPELYYDSDEYPSF